MWPVKNSQVWFPTQHVFPTLQFPWDRPAWSQGLRSQPANGRERCGKMALLRVGTLSSKMIPDGSRYNRSLALSQESAIRLRRRVRICYWTAKHMAHVTSKLDCCVVTWEKLWSIRRQGTTTVRGFVSAWPCRMLGAAFE